MTSRLIRLAPIALLVLGMPALAAAEETPAPELSVREEPGVQHELQPLLTEGEPVRSITPQTPGGWGDPTGEIAIDDWQRQNPYGYGTDVIFPLTRGVMAADLDLWAKIPVYPLAAIFDVIQLPIGALGGLWGK
jgi:hypothetical protein